MKLKTLPVELWAVASDGGSGRFLFATQKIAKEHAPNLISRTYFDIEKTLIAITAEEFSKILKLGWVYLT